MSSRMSLSHRCDHISTAPERCRVRVFLLASVTSSLLAAVTSPSFDCGCTGSSMMNQVVGFSQFDRFKLTEAVFYSLVDYI
ncbi:unnamed protein product [Brassica rapa]|uniref:Uncharacterized protein n=2 Tax=Brassica TaxID=3705 RepID=A0A8D9I147_BRACM|nr:unnamed protein product [Brassica napus]CAG7908462.1 unnamed protein product [Brassica rapa]